LPEDIYDHYLDVNLKGTWLGMKYSIPEMLKAGAGSIINVASIAALEGTRFLPHYSAAKGGVISLSRVTAVEYAAKNIRVNCICPGHIITPEQEAYNKANPDHLKLMAAMGVPVIGHMVPMGRSGRAEEVANLALFLASDESSYITGSVITIDGGATASSIIQL
jgi:NAD(P)-dependent dehydrogenase (short-subunit alcohol dehydrogenase family)